MLSDKVSEAMRVIRQWYCQAIRSLAEEGWEKVQSGNLTSAEALQEWLRETIDSHDFTIDTLQSKMVLLASRNSDACAEDFGGAVCDECVNWDLMAQCAMERDLAEQLEALGVDVNDPCPEEGPGGDELEGGASDD